MSDAVVLERPTTGLLARRLKGRARVLARAYPRETIGLTVLGFVSFVALGTALVPGVTTPAAHASPPAPPPLIMKQIAPDQAIKVNADIPLASGPNPAAKAFVFSGSAADRQQAVNCLASAVYYEAGNQDPDGGRAVAQVVLNRVRHPAFPASVCGVVYEGSTRTTGCQFTFTCDGSLARGPAADAWRRATRIAEDALSGAVFAPVGWATHYHADYVVPYWAPSLAKNVVLGSHIFYRWAGGWGRPGAFTEAHAGREPSAAALRTAALAVPHTVGAGPEQEVAEALKAIPGAETVKLEPSMRGDKRVAVRFNLAAREASNQVVPEVYEKKFDASDNLKWTLSSETTAADQKPLGSSAPAAPAPTSAGSATMGGTER